MSRSTQSNKRPEVVTPVSVANDEHDLSDARFRTRRRLPDTRNSITHKFNISGHEGYFTVGLYENGTPGELFIVMPKEGSTMSGLMDTVGVLTSMALQHGVRAIARS